MNILDKNRQGLTKQQSLQKKRLEEDAKKRFEIFEKNLPEFQKEYFALTRKYKIDFFITHKWSPARGPFGVIIPVDISRQLEQEEKAKAASEVVGAEKNGNGVVNN